MKSYRFIITGKVQGVYYRANIQKNSQSFGYSGYVKNLPNGTVEATVTCEDSQLDGFINILKQGSKYSVVNEIKQFEADEVFRGKFQIK